MFFERSDQDFVKAGNSPAEREALLHRLRRSRRATLVYTVATFVFGVGCGIWAALILLQSVEAVARGAGDEIGAETGLTTAISTAQILKFVMFAIVFQLPFAFIHLFRLDTSIKLLLYLEARERISASGS